jgi:hypothetical protein
MLHRLKGGGFELRLKAGLVGPRADWCKFRETHARGSLAITAWRVGLSFDLNAKAVSTTLVRDSIPCRLKAWGLQIPYRGL